MKKLFIFLSLILSFGNILAQPRVSNTSYTTANGEKVLRLEMILPVSRQVAWTYFTTDEKMKKWMAPVVHIELKTGGFIRTNYNPKKTLSDSSSIQLDIVNYLEKELLTLKVELNDNFPKNTQASDQNLQQLLQFVDEGDNHTRIISSMLGWRQGSEWDQTYNFFVQGNSWTFEQLLKLFP